MDEHSCSRSIGNRRNDFSNWSGHLYITLHPPVSKKARIVNETGTTNFPIDSVIAVEEEADFSCLKNGIFAQETASIHKYEPSGNAINYHLKESHFS
jgi:hypothetical protein